jgi:hypothetical protein
MKITNIHEEATCDVHGTTLGPGQSIEGEKCKGLLTTFPGVSAMFGCGVLDGDDEAKALVGKAEAKQSDGEPAQNANPRPQGNGNPRR